MRKAAMSEDPKSDGLDPEIRGFVRKMEALWRECPPLSDLALPERRQIAEKVRAYWARGGPVMARSHESCETIPSSGPSRPNRTTRSVAGS